MCCRWARYTECNRRRVLSGDVWATDQFTAARSKQCRRNSQANRIAACLPPVTAAVRQRLQAVFEHAQRSAEKADYDYAHDLFTQCLVDDPANLIFLQHFLGQSAHKSTATTRKGPASAALKSKASRMTLNKAAGKGQWREAFAAACDALKSNPWDTATLLDVADAYEQIGSDECQLFVLRWALDAAPKDVTVNRRAAETLARLGQFDQAISCWRRVEQAKPGDEEAAKAISQLSVEKTIQKGGYNQELLHGAVADPSSDRSDDARSDAAPGDPMHRAAAGTESKTGRAAANRKLLDAIAAQPAEVANYLELAELFTAQNRLREAEEILARALAASGGGDLSIRERLEDAHLRRAQHQVPVAQRRAEQDKTAEAADLGTPHGGAGESGRAGSLRGPSCAKPGQLAAAIRTWPALQAGRQIQRGDSGVSGGARRCAA